MTTMTLQDWGVFLGFLIPFVLCCLLAVVGGMKLIDLADRARERRGDRKR